MKSLEEDLLRRDFTMNAIAMTKDGELIDPFDGRSDLDKHLIRSVGNPSDRFKEEPSVCSERFVFRLFLILRSKKETFLAICDYAEQLRHVSTERVKMEMDKLFTGINPVKALSIWRIPITFISTSLSK